MPITIPINRPVNRSICNDIYATGIPAGFTTVLSEANGLSSAVTVARNSIGTRFNSSGILETISANLPRFDYDPSTLAFRGLLIEEQRTNIALRSSELDAAVWTEGGVVVTPDTTVSPDGTTNADTLAVSLSGGSKSAVQTVTATATGYTASLFIQSGTDTLFRFGLVQGSFLAAAGSVLYGSASISGANLMSVTASAAWSRISLRTTGAATAGGLKMYLYPGGTTAVDQVVGDSVIVYGVQLEPGAFATSPIPTTSAAATRYADDLTVSSLDSIRFNPAGGTLYVSGTAPPYLAQAAVLASFNDNTANNVIRLRMDSSANLYAEVITSGATQASINLGALTANTAFKVALSYEKDNIRACLNGGTVGTDSSATPPSVDRLMIGRGTAGEYWNSGIKELKYAPHNSADSLLKALTA